MQFLTQDLLLLRLSVIGVICVVKLFREIIYMRRQLQIELGQKNNLKAPDLN